MRRRTILWLVVGLVFLHLLAIGIAVVEWYATKLSGDRELAVAVAKTDEENPKWRIHDLVDAHNATLPADEKNGALVVKRAVASISAEFDDWCMKNWDQLIGNDHNRLPDPKLLAELLPLLERCRPALDLLYSAPQLPPGGHRITVTHPNPFDVNLSDTYEMRRREQTARSPFDCSVVEERRAGRGQELHGHSGPRPLYR